MKKISRSMLIFLLGVLIFSSTAQYSFACDDAYMLTLLMPNGQRIANNTIDINNDLARVSVDGSFVNTMSFNWSTSNPSVAKVGLYGEIIPCSAGSTVITATAASGNYGSCVVTITEKVNPGTPNEIDLAKGQNYQIAYNFYNDSFTTNGNIEWSSSDTNVSTVSSSGYVNAKAVGAAVITAKCYMTVSNNLVNATTGPPTTDYPAYSMDLSNDIDISSTDESIISTTSGAINAEKTGTAVILARSYVSVIEPYIELNQIALVLQEGNSKQLTEMIYPASMLNKSVTWSSSNPAIATVDENGTVTGIKQGTCTITVRTVAGNKTATCEAFILGQASLDSEKTFQIVTNEEYIIAANVENISSFNDVQFKIVYDPSKIIFLNQNSQFNSDINIISERPGEIIFRVEKSLVADKSFSGVVGLFKFRGISSGPTTIYFFNN